MNSLIAYLQSLAPRFFKKHVRGATEAEIKTVEKAAGMRLTDNHRVFLRALGKTPPEVLNPFLTKREWSVPALIDFYDEWKATGYTLPHKVVIFSNSNILGETIFLRHRGRLDQDPEIGDLDSETGRFIRKDDGYLLDYLRSFAFSFRLSQPALRLMLSPRWDKARKKYRGEPKACWKALLKLGLRPVFSLHDGTRCADSGALAAIVYADGSGRVTGDRRTDLQRAKEALRGHVWPEITPVTGYRAARD